MTCCVGIVTPEGGILAADTCVSEGDLIYERAAKVFRARRGLLAVAGTAGVTDQIAAQWCKGTGSLDSLIGMLRDRDGVGEDCSLLWLGNKGLYSLDGKGAAGRSRFRFAAVGSGMEVALGFLGASMQADCISLAQENARQCLEFVTKCVANVRPPWQIETWPKKKVLAPETGNA